MLKHHLSRLGTAFALITLAPLAAAQAQVNMYCSFPDTAWCQAMANGFRKASGIPVNVTQKATGELYAQVRAERENPKGDIWWAGPGDAFVQAGQEGLLDEYRSPALGELHDWARRQAEITNYRSVGVYAGILTLGYNKELVAKKKLAVPKCWKDLLVPELKGEIQLSNPNSSGTSYMMLATLVQVMGEEEAFKYMKALHPSVSQYARSGTGPLKAVARGEAIVGVSVLHGVVNEVVNGFPVDVIMPCEGTGYEIASMGVIKGSRNLEAARKFYDWALSTEAQKLQFEVKQFPIPSNKSVPLPATVPKLSDIKLISYDFAKYGAAAERKRLLDRWDRDILGSK
jgi:iron(III) transport system substrate-binding protein